MSVHASPLALTHAGLELALARRLRKWQIHFLWLQESLNHPMRTERRIVVPCSLAGTSAVSVMDMGPLHRQKSLCCQASTFLKRSTASSLTTQITLIYWLPRIKEFLSPQCCRDAERRLASLCQRGSFMFSSYQ